MFFLDTNICIYYLNGRYESVKRRLLELSPAQISIPAIVKAELLFGAFKSRQRQTNIAKVEAFLSPFGVVAFTDRTAVAYAQIRHAAESAGQIIGPNDLLIAAIVQEYGGTLVTNNAQEFGRIEGLRIENWVS